MGARIGWRKWEGGVHPSSPSNPQEQVPGSAGPQGRNNDPVVLLFTTGCSGGESQFGVSGFFSA